MITVKHATIPPDGSQGEVGYAEWAEEHEITGTLESFPVGAIYITNQVADPADTFGYGTWTLLRTLTI